MRVLVAVLVVHLGLAVAHTALAQPRAPRADETCPPGQIFVEEIGCAPDPLEVKCPPRARPEGGRCVCPPGLKLDPAKGCMPSLGSSGCPADMVPLPGGSLRVRNRVAAEVAPFCLDIGERTVAKYTLCVGAKACTPAKVGEGCNTSVAGRGDHPVNCVDWAQADAYCRSIGARLPTEAEWEWAARGGKAATPYPWGLDEPSMQLCWSGENPRQGTCRGGSFAAGDNPMGVQDLAGNVWEWVADLDSPDERLVRGGGWKSRAPASVKAMAHSHQHPRARLVDIGFRCAFSQ